MVHLAYGSQDRRKAAFAVIYDIWHKFGKDCGTPRERPSSIRQLSSWYSYLFTVDQVEDTYRARWHKYCLKRLQV